LRLAVVAHAVGKRAQQPDVEGQLPEALGVNEQRARGPDRVPHAKLVEHVGIGASEVGHGVFAQHQPLEHRLVDDATRTLLVGADRRKPRASRAAGAIKSS
jgi:hypothetical protein